MNTLSTTEVPQRVDTEEQRAAEHRLARLHSIGRWKALALVAPLFLFLLLVFLVPIAILLTRAVDNREVSAVLPRTNGALAGRHADEAPTAAAADALVA